MSKKTTIMDGLVDQLKDLYSAENQLLKALPKMAKKATSEELKQAITSHLSETEKQVQRLESIGELLEQKLSGKTCKAMKGLIEEGQEVLEEESANEALIDAMLIGAAQRVEHYEMAGYGTARAFAEQLGQDEIVQLLQATLDEEMAADEKLSVISEEEVLLKASEFGMEEGEGDTSKSKGKMSSRKTSSNGMRTAAALLVGALFMPFAIARAMPNPQMDMNHSSSSYSSAPAYAKDNTAQNIRSRNSVETVGEDLKLTAPELEMLARIRREIVANDQLSTDAHNIKISVRDGAVILRGPVKSAEERKWLESKSATVASGYRVVSELEVKAG